MINRLAGIQANHVDAVHVGRKKISDTQIQGVTSNIHSMMRMDLEAGRFFSPVEEEHSAAVAIIGSDIKDQVFPNVSPLGQLVYIRGYPVLVIGLQARKGSILGQNREAGVKAGLFENRLTVTAAVYRVDKTNAAFSFGGSLSNAQLDDLFNPNNLSNTAPGYFVSASGFNGESTTAPARIWAIRGSTSSAPYELPTRAENSVRTSYGVARFP